MSHDKCAAPQAQEEPTSAQLLYREHERKMQDSLPFLPQEPPRSAVYDEKANLLGPVKDYSGEITGTGVKAVMASPKTPIELIDPYFVEGIAAVLLHGARKYAPNNWLNGMSWTTVFGGIMRHLWAFFRGEELDPETGLPHLHHAGCGLMFLAHYAHGPRSKKYREVGDDRVFKAIEPA